MQNLVNFIEILRPIAVSGPIDFPITTICYDSRQVQPGAAFFAIHGLETDGNDFVNKAIKNGAKAIISQLNRSDENVTNIQVTDTRVALAQASRCFFDFPDEKLNLVGVTGTNGKSTTCFLIHAILEKAGFKTGLTTTIEYRTGNEVKPTFHTTPAAPDLQRVLREMLDADCSHVVTEVTSHGISQKRIFGIPFQRAVFTNLSQEHLDFHKTREAYLAAKLELFENLPASSIGIVNADDPVAKKFSDASPAALTFSSNNQKADIRGELLSNGVSGFKTRIYFPEKSVEIESKLVGNYNLYNLLAAATTCFSVGIEIEKIVAGIKSLQNVPGRFEEISTDSNFKVFVDFAHTPQALRQVLLNCRNFCTGQLKVVFGCGGERDHEKRPQMALIAEEMADFTYLTTDNPRREDPRKILTEIDSGFTDKNKRLIILDRREAIFEAIKSTKSGDIILVAGRGHETKQMFGTGAIPFDDRKICREIIWELGIAPF